jgi:hypothetical protein
MIGWTEEVAVVQSVFVTPVWTCLKQLGLMTRFPSAEEWKIFDYYKAQAALHVVD